MLKFGIIGKKLSHSFSPKYFKDKISELSINADYLPYEINDKKNLSEIFALGLQGFNVTIPYKQDIIPLLDDLEEDAKEIKAVNCVLHLGNNKYRGYNTDVFGFTESLKPFIGKRKKLTALVLGNGGAAQAVVFGLKKLDIPYQIVSRNTGNYNYDDIPDELISQTKLIVNTTPLGMYPDIDHCPPLNYDLLDEDHILYDLIYNPEKTLFLKNGENKKATIINGYKMLILQAEKSWEIWNQKIIQ